MSTKIKTFLRNKEIAANHTSYSLQTDGQSYIYNGSICKKNNGQSYIYHGSICKKSKFCIKILQLSQAFPCYRYIIKSISVSITSTRKNTYFSINHDLQQDVVILSNFLLQTQWKFKCYSFFKNLDFTEANPRYACQRYFSGNETIIPICHLASIVIILLMLILNKVLCVQIC